MIKDDREKLEEKTKMCPMLGKYCIKEQCAIWTQMNRGPNVIVGTCIFHAIAAILSEINMKTEGTQQKIIPKLYLQ